jgi:hypothetical protein
MTTQEKRTLPIAEDSPAPRVCRMLRTKMAFGTIEGMKHDWREGRSMSASYWCLRTMEPWGPDDHIAEAGACRSGRACFESDAEDVA